MVNKNAGLSSVFICTREMLNASPVQEWPSTGIKTQKHKNTHPISASSANERGLSFVSIMLSIENIKIAFVLMVCCDLFANCIANNNRSDLKSQQDVPRTEQWATFKW